MKPIMNPPPVTMLGIENTSIMIPHAFLCAGLMRSSMAPSNTRTPNIRPTAVRRKRTVVSLADDPGSVGIIPGNHLAATPRSAVLLNIKIPAIRDKVKAFVGFSLRLIYFHKWFFSYISLPFFILCTIDLN